VYRDIGWVEGRWTYITCLQAPILALTLWNLPPYFLNAAVFPII